MKKTLLKPIQILVILSLFFAVGCKKDVPVTDVKFDKSNIILAAGTTETLTATVLPQDATDKSVSWTSSDEAVVITVANRIVIANKEGTATIIVSTKDGKHKDTCTVTVTPDTLKWVEINGVKWAKCNVDTLGTFAAHPEDAGMFYQWNRKIGWSPDSLSSHEGGKTWDNSIPTGNSWDKANDPCPTGWRVPTQAEQVRLVNSGSEWTKLNGVNGRYFGTGERRVVFLPAVGYRDNDTTGMLGNKGGYGYYWSRDPIDDNDKGAHGMYFSIEGVGTNKYGRNFGFSVRCVKE